MSVTKATFNYLSNHVDPVPDEQAAEKFTRKFVKALKENDWAVTEVSITLISTGDTDLSFSLKANHVHPVPPSHLFVTYMEKFLEDMRGADWVRSSGQIINLDMKIEAT